MHPDPQLLEPASRAPVIYIVDDELEIRRSLALLLTEHGRRVVTFESAESLLAALPRFEHGLILTDVRLPGMSGVSLVRAVAELQRHDPVIVMTAHGDVSLAVEAMKAGATEFLEKPFSPETLLHAIEVATPKPPQPTASGAAARIRALSAREREVLAQLIGGATNKRIALALGLSPRTVDVYRAKIMKKMQAPSLPQLVLMAIEGGMAGE